MKVVEMNEMYKSFSQRQNQQSLILDGASLTLNQGDYAVIRGTNGVGKTTLLNILLGYLPFDKGSLNLFGMDIGSLEDAEFSLLRLNDIGYMPQETNLLSFFTVKENILAPTFLSKKENPLIDDWMRRLNLKEIESEQSHFLSGGERKKTQFLRAIVNMPKLLILDEPSAGLDDLSIRNLLDFLEELNQSMTILVVSHDERMFCHANKKYRLENGKIVNDGNSG